MDDSDTRGFLREADKKYLRGEIDYEHRQSEYNRRQNIRDHVVAAMQDFELLLNHWSPTEMEETMDKMDVEQRVEDIISFLYIATNEYALDLDHMVDHGPSDRSLAFRHGLVEGVRRGKQHFDSDPPNPVIVCSNTDLHELPTEEDILSCLDTDHWRTVYKRHCRSVDGSDDEVIEKEEAATSFYGALVGSIEADLYHRHAQVGFEVQSHDINPGSRGYFSSRISSDEKVEDIEGDSIENIVPDSIRED